MNKPQELFLDKHMYGDLSLKELNKYDLKQELFNNEVYKKYYIKLIKNKNICNLEYEDLFDDKHILERYLVYKIIGNYTYFNDRKNYFDCDKIKYIENSCNCKKEESTDTLLSVQSIFGRLCKKILDSEIIELSMYLKNIDLIKKELGPNLLEKIEYLIIYYHTIGNICACPENKYNLRKGNYHYFDRLDIFKKSKIFKDYSYWFTEERLKKEYLEDIYNGEGLLKIDIINDLNKDNIKDNQNVIDYIDAYIKLIKDRGIKIIEKN